MLARQFSSQDVIAVVDQEIDERVSTGLGKRLARTPAPCTSRTGPRSGGRGPLTWIKFKSMPSPALNGTDPLDPLRSDRHLSPDLFVAEPRPAPNRNPVSLGCDRQMSIAPA